MLVKKNKREFINKIFFDDVSLAAFNFPSSISISFSFSFDDKFKRRGGLKKKKQQKLEKLLNIPQIPLSQPTRQVFWCDPISILGKN